MKHEMPRASPGFPLVRAKMRSKFAECRPELKRFVPLRIQSEPSRLPVVSSHVASLP
jgi:hypothetical protein